MAWRKLGMRYTFKRCTKIGLQATSLILLNLIPGMLVLESAHASDASPLKLTLRDAVQMALKQNPQVQISNLEFAQSEQDKKIARSSLLPTLGATVAETAVRSNFEAFTGKPIPGIPKQIGPFQTFQGGGAFSMPLFDLTLWRQLQASNYAMSATAAQSQTTREQTTLLVVSQYLGCQRAAADIKAAQSRVELAETLYTLAASLQENGVGTGIDTLRANVQLQNEKQRLMVAETESKTGIYGLAHLLNIDPEQKIELVDTISFFETPVTDVDRLLDQAYKARPELRAIEARQQALRKQRQAASAARLPSILAQGMWSYYGLSIPNSIPTYQYQVSVSAPLFTGGRISAEVAKIDLELKKLDQEMQELRNVIALQAKVSAAQLEAARNEVEVANLGLKLANETVSQARDRFEAGVANNVEVVTAQDDLARANDNQINALYKYNQARADMARAFGQIEMLYSK
jgi:outer membrane protein TolC